MLAKRGENNISGQVKDASTHVITDQCYHKWSKNVRRALFKCPHQVVQFSITISCAKKYLVTRESRIKKVEFINRYSFQMFFEIEIFP